MEKAFMILANTPLSELTVWPRQHCLLHAQGCFAFSRGW